MSHSSLRILGIDPGLNVTGYAVLECSDGKPPAVRGGRRAGACAGIDHGPGRGDPSRRGRGDRRVAADRHGDRRALFALRAAEDGDPDGPRPGRDLPGRRPGRRARRPLRRHASEEDHDGLGPRHQGDRSSRRSNASSAFPPHPSPPTSPTPWPSPCAITILKIGRLNCGNSRAWKCVSPKGFRSVAQGCGAAATLGQAATSGKPQRGFGAGSA